MTPEGSRYRADINLRWVNDAHILALGRVPANSRVLDLGAADGSMAETLTRMGCRVWGVEIDPEAAAQAREWCEEVVVSDLDQLDLAAQFGQQKFDVVLMLDVLEHLSDPGRTLRGVQQVLSERGWGILSIPNVAHISVRLDLLEGRFTYRDTGLLDRTHLRFFDRAGLNALLAEAGWEAFDTAYVKKALGSTEIPVTAADPGVVRRLEEDPDSKVYQFIVSAAPSGSPVLVDRPVLPAAEAQALALELLDSVAALEEGVEWLRGQVVPNLPEQMEGIRVASEDRRRQLRDLLVALQEDTERLRRSLAG